MPAPAPIGRTTTLAVLVWLALAALIAAPLAIAASSPLLASRNTAYVVAGLAGAAAMAVLVIQPLLAAGYLPGLPITRAKAVHRWAGAVLFLLVAAHVGGLYLTSPADAVDALLLVSPTPFSVYGVAAMWALILTLLLVSARRRLGWRPSFWRIFHNALAAVIVIGSVVHALLIDGTMGPMSKLILCSAVLAISAAVLIQLRVIRPLRSRRSRRADGP